MKPTHQRGRSRFYGLYLIQAITVVGALQLLIYLLVIENTIGPFALFGPRKLAHPSMVGEFRVAVVHSETTARQYTEHPEFYFDLARQWESVLKENGISFRAISDVELTPALADQYSAVVLPSVTCLGDGQRRAVRHLLASGRGIIASGALGSRNARCEWQGWEFLQEISGVQSPFTVSADGSILAGFRGQTFFSDGVPTGYNLNLPRQEFVIANTNRPDIYWADWRLRPAQGRSPADVSLGVHGERGKGRFVWFGFSEILPSEQKEDRRVLDRYLASAVRWVGRQPLAVVANWPNRKQAAVILIEELQSNYKEAMAGAELLAKQNVRAVFVCDPEAARAMPEVLRTLGRAGELVSSGEAAATGATGREALRQMKRELETATQLEFSGFRAGTEAGWQSDAIRNAGFRYILDERGATHATPDLLDGARIFRTSSDDFEIIANYRGPSPWGEELAQEFMPDFRRNVDLGGVHTFAFRSDLLGAAENLHILNSVISRMKAEPVWITGASELVDWWSARAGLRVESKRIGPNRIRLSVTNKGLTDVDNFSVYLFLPYRPQKIRVTPAVLRLVLPRSELTGDDNILRLDFQRLGHQSSHVLLVALDES
jgi:hypothetical protein